MNQYFQIAYVDGDITLFQLYQLYKMKILSISQCSEILRIKEASVRQKFSRMKIGNVNQKVLRAWEKNRLIKELEKKNDQITEVLKPELESNHERPQ